MWRKEKFLEKENSFNYKKLRHLTSKKLSAFFIPYRPPQIKEWHIPQTKLNISY